MTLPTYSPDSTKIKVGGKLITGLADNFLDFASHRGFTLKLHAASESIDYLFDLIGNKSHVLTEVSIWVDLFDKDEWHIDLFDIDGEYILTGWSYSLSTSWPEMTFNFIHNSPIYN